jgi:hypothetical protein
MLSHVHYRKFTRNFVGKLVNHDDTIPEAKLDMYVKDTDLAWKKRNEKRREAMAPAPSSILSSPSQTEKPKTTEFLRPVIITDKKFSGIKGRLLKSFFSSSSSKSSNTTQKASAAPSNLIGTSPKNGYQNATNIFQGFYVEGSYKSSPPYKVAFESSNEEDEKIVRTVGETGYDKEKVSFHDRSELPELIISI